MKFNFLYSLSATILLGLNTNLVLSLVSFYNEKPVNAGNLPSYIYEQTDTIKVSDDMMKKAGSFAAGVFMPESGKIKLYYFQHIGTNTKVRNFCNSNNRQMRLVLRHEKEHARKANLTKNIWYYSPNTRGAIAAQNEIVAPAAEIIEALDYRFETGHRFPTNKNFIKKADDLIIKAATEQRLTWPLNYNNQQLADIIMECATERFVSETKRGLYKTTIKNAINNCDIPRKYITNNLCNEYNQIIFCPHLGAWGQMWQFESKHGPVNIWDAASSEQKKKLINTVDSIVMVLTGQNYIFLQKQKIR